MMIAISSKNKLVADKLRGLGYTVVDIHAKAYADAILYNSKYEEGFLDQLEAPVMTNSIENKGVLLVDIRGKNIDIIDAILKRRLYTPLF